MKKSARFKQILLSDSTEYLMEAHSGLSARIVEDAGFTAIWGSGLSISASMGVRDANEASWTQILEILEFMSDATSIPILVDADTGYGNFNNVRRLVKKLEQRNIAAVCIEDKIFPKTNSLINGASQPLADIDEFSGKIKAAKDVQLDDDFCVVARVEALIAGHGMGEALRRAEAYRQAGADAILIHSKLSEPDEVLTFMQEWNDRCPVVLVPTMYFNTPSQVFEEAGASVIIWANHTLRASIRAMQETVGMIYRQRSVIEVQERIVSLKDVFTLQKLEELQKAEGKYLPRKNNTH